MIKLSSLERHDSKSFPGVTVVVRRITEALRQGFREEVAEHNDAIREISEEQDKLLLEPEKDSVKLGVLDDQLVAHTDAIRAALLSHFLVGIEGLEVDDVQVNKENFRETAPQVLYSEVAQLVQDRCALGGAEIKNSESPSTSTKAE